MYILVPICRYLLLTRQRSSFAKQYSRMDGREGGEELEQEQERIDTIFRIEDYRQGINHIHR